MTLLQIFNAAMQVFGIPDSANAPQPAKDQALIEINATIQQLANSGEDFFTREELEITIVAATENYRLPKHVQTVLEPAKLSTGKKLTLLTSRGQLLQFGEIFLGQLDNSVAAGSPEFYFVESLRDTGAPEDNVAIIVHLLPRPSAAFIADSDEPTLVLNVIKEPPQFTAEQLTAGTSTMLVPHKYAESVFLPIMRRGLTRSFLFYDEAKRPGIDADYERALALISKADPRRPKPPESRPDALEQRPTGGQPQ